MEKLGTPANAATVFASISQPLGKQIDAISMMENLLETGPGLQATDRCRIHFTLGDTYNSKGDYDSAFEHYFKGNRLKQTEFKSSRFTREIDALINSFHTDFFTHTAKASLHSNRPVFVVGMPRSGTSLVEQILSSHSKVFGAGELPDIINLSNRLGDKLKSQDPYPKCVSQLTIEKIDHFAKQYLDHLSRMSGDAVRVTDKMPANFMHLGLINILFPEARVIHCRPNPLDTCLSCYFQDFGPSHSYAYDLTNLGAYYQQYLRIMEHWQNSLTLPILDIQYEALINNQETVSRNMLNFCELDWEDQCLDFHNNKRFVWTASYAQVRKPIYRHSVNRWKNYEHHIDPLRKALKSANAFKL
jgi:hypothetical protein